MTRLLWDDRGERFFEMGVDRGVLYVSSSAGVAWMGLTSVAENITGGEPRPYYLDGEKYLNLLSAEEFEATIEAFGCPDEFGVCDGNVEIHTGLIATQQPRQPFGFCYRTRVGNEISGPDLAYKLHLVYNALAAPTQRNNTTLGGSADPTKFSWSITTKPPAITGYKRTAHLVIDSRTTDPDVLSDVEDALYGTVSTDPYLPDPDDLIAMFTP
jgi:hypothetical protein